MAGALARPADRRLVTRLLRALALAALALLVFLAIVFAARRLAGGFDHPPSGAALVTLAAVLAAVIMAIRIGVSERCRAGTPYLVSTQHWLILATASLCAALLLASLTFPGTAAWGIGVAWFALVAAVLICWRPVHRRRPSGGTVIDEPDLDAPPANLVQQLTRQRVAVGDETLHALAEAEIPAGDRLAVVHLAFCPPLEVAPQLTAHALGAEDAEVKITTAESYGVRLEVRLPKSASQPRRVLVEVIGRATNPAAGRASL